ncbi:MAG: nitronate monooxygenase [Opitutales bacterium]|nr:nitronate monooxygenase [Opitutales bacterium]
MGTNVQIGEYPQVIQGGMGIGVSNWRLAKSVSQSGQLGVVSGTALDSVAARRLQLGDNDGSIRRALSHFPFPEMANRVLEKHFVEGGKPDEKPFGIEPLPSLKMRQSQLDLLIVSNFAEVYLAKEGHNNSVGINFMEKIQLPLLPSLFGALIAGVDYVLIGAGIPLSIPGILDDMSSWQAVSLKLDVDGNSNGDSFMFEFDPSEFVEAEKPVLRRPKFLAVVSSEIVAKSLIRRANGVVNGFVVETPDAGGHNAPPRKKPISETNEPIGFGPKDIPNMERIRGLGNPFWIAGSQASPSSLQSALSCGAKGIQVGSAFAFCEESGIDTKLKHEVVEKGLKNVLKVKTDFQASPTGYPFKLADVSETISDPEKYQDRKRVCDLGYLRQAYTTGDGKVGFRCPGEPKHSFLSKGGREADTVGKVCLCNGLLSTIGLGQSRGAKAELPIVTAGVNFDFLNYVVIGPDPEYSAKQVIDYLTRNKAVV